MGFFYGIQHPFARLQGKQSSSKKWGWSLSSAFYNLLSNKAYKQYYGFLKYVTCWLFAHESHDLSEAETIVISWLE